MKSDPPTDPFDWPSSPMEGSTDDGPRRTTFVLPDQAPAMVEPDRVAHYLVVIEGGGRERGRRVEVGVAAVTIGREARRTLVLDDTEISRLHLTVRLVDDEVVVEDAGSTNGTYLGADRLAGPVTLRDGSVLRLGRCLIRYERRARRDVEQNEELQRDLRRARDYVLSLLPSALVTGPVRVDWHFAPSAELGGDAFGYEWLDPDTFACYLIDVSGHGIGAAMHSVSVLNDLRHRALTGVDFRDPAQVLGSLNHRFQMERHNGMYFTIWYGVYRPANRTMTYGSAGHHPAYLVPAARQTAETLGYPSLMIGVLPDVAYEVREAVVPAGSRIYLFSDGVFEFVTTDGRRSSLTDFEPLLSAPERAGVPETDRVWDAIGHLAGPGGFDDDCSLLVVTVP
jgi:serine phosphatase RsbU (regulator of sigma subunit)